MRAGFIQDNLRMSKVKYMCNSGSANQMLQAGNVFRFSIHIRILMHVERYVRIVISAFSDELREAACQQTAKCPPLPARYVAKDLFMQLNTRTLGPA